MKIIAIAPKGHEFMYKIRTAHKVSDKYGKAIMDTLNSAGYGLKENEVWHMYKVDEYDQAYAFAEYQRFTVRKGRIIEYGA